MASLNSPFGFGQTFTPLAAARAGREPTNIDLSFCLSSQGNAKQETPDPDHFLDHLAEASLYCRVYPVPPGLRTVSTNVSAQTLPCLQTSPGTARPPLIPRPLVLHPTYPSYLPARPPV